MDQSDSRDWSPTDPVARKRAIGGVRHRTGGKFNEGFGEWDFGQPPHVFKVVTDKTKELQSDKEPYWRWECKCGARWGGYKSRETARDRGGDRHSIDANKGKSKPVGREATVHDKPFVNAAADRVSARREDKKPDAELHSAESLRQNESSQTRSSQTPMHLSKEMLERDAHDRIKARRDSLKARPDRRRQS